jgi:hypothetical protein
MCRTGSEPVFALTFMTGRVIKLPQGKKITRLIQVVPNSHAVSDLEQHAIGIPVATFSCPIV